MAYRQILLIRPTPETGMLNFLSSCWWTGLSDNCRTLSSKKMITSSMRRPFLLSYTVILSMRRVSKAIFFCFERYFQREVPKQCNSDFNNNLNFGRLPMRWYYLKDKCIWSKYRLGEQIFKWFCKSYSTPAPTDAFVSEIEFPKPLLCTNQDIIELSKRTTLWYIAK